MILFIVYAFNSAAKFGLNNRFERSRAASSVSQGGVGAWDKSAPFVASATALGPTSSLAGTPLRKASRSERRPYENVR